METGTFWNSGVLKMDDGLGCLDEDLEEFIRATNRNLLRLMQEGDVNLVEQMRQARVMPRIYLVDEVAHVIRQLKNGL